MKKTLLFVSTLLLSVSMFAGDIVNFPEKISIMDFTLAAKINSVEFIVEAEDIATNGGSGGAVVFNCGPGWDQMEWGIGGMGEAPADKPLSATYTGDLNGTATLSIVRPVGDYNLVGEGQYGQYVEFTLAHWWGATLTFVNFITYDAEGKVLYSYNPIDEPQPSEADYKINFANDLIQGIYWTPDAPELTTTVNGDVLEVMTSNWNSYPKFAVNFPNGQTIADVEKITFEILLNEDAPDITWKSFHLFVGAPGATFVPNEATLEAKNLIGSDAKGEWLKKEISGELLATLSAELLALGKFDLGFGLGIPAGNGYSLKDITFVGVDADGTSISLPLISTSKVIAVDGGINVTNNGQVVNVYGFDGRLVKTTNENFIGLNKGLYIVKVGTENAVKVIVR